MKNENKPFKRNPKHDQEAQAVGLTILGSGKNKGYRLYKFNSCNHQQELHVGNVRKNEFCCNICDTSRGYDPQKQGLFYLIRWTSEDGHSVLKFGITNRVDYLKRIAEQARETKYNPYLIKVKYYIDGSTPPELEKKVHTNLKTGVIDKSVFGDGFTETVHDTKENENYILSIM